jgi:hypothetical protein
LAGFFGFLIGRKRKARPFFPILFWKKSGSGRNEKQAPNWRIKQPEIARGIGDRYDYRLSSPLVICPRAAIPVAYICSENPADVDGTSPKNDLGLGFSAGGYPVEPIKKTQIKL